MQGEIQSRNWAMFGSMSASGDLRAGFEALDRSQAVNEFAPTAPSRRPTPGSWPPWATRSTRSGAQTDLLALNATIEAARAGPPTDAPDAVRDGEGGGRRCRAPEPRASARPCTGALRPHARGRAVGGCAARLAVHGPPGRGGARSGAGGLRDARPSRALAHALGRDAGGGGGRPALPKRQGGGRTATRRACCRCWSGRRFHCTATDRRTTSAPASPSGGYRAARRAWPVAPRATRCWA